MSNPLGGRGQDKLMAMCSFPSINYTPFKHCVPIPYPVWRMLGNSEETAPTVKFNDSEVYILNQTYQPDCIGDFPGQGGGIKSDTVSDEVRPTKGSETILVTGQHLIRKGDPCTLNKANTFGKYTALGDVMSGLAHFALGALSFLPPPVGTIASVADAAIYAIEGDAVGAAMSLAGAIPGCKWAMAAAKLGKGIKAVTAGGKLANSFSKAGAWIKGTRLGKVKPCVLGDIGSGLLAAHAIVNAVEGAVSYVQSVISFFGSPVHAYRGAKVLMGGDELDYQGEGYLPFYLQRLYNSQNPETGWFGQGWKVQGLEQYLELHPQQDTIYLSDNSGRKIPFSYLKPGQRSYQPYENITLYRPPLDDAQKDTLLTGQPILANATSGTRIGDNEPLHFILYQGDYDPSRPNNTNSLTDGSDPASTELTDTLLTADPIYQHNNIAIHYQTVTQRSQTHAIVRVSKQTDKHGHSLQLHYSHDLNSPLAHLPEYITDSNQHSYRLEFSLINTHPRLTKLWQVQHIDQPQTLLVDYHYDSQGDLVQVHNRGQLVREFAYTDHLITWQRYLTGLEGNYSYDQTHNPATARVIDHTLNTGQHYRFIYDTDAQGNHYSTVIEQPGTPLEKQHHYISDDYYYLTQYTDPLGNTTKLTYDHLSRLIEVRDPKGGRSKLEYHGKQLGRVTHKLGIDPHTGLPIYRQYLYHYDKDQLNAITDPLGNTDRLTYNSTGDVASYTDANGNTSHYDYDSDGNLIRHTLANGSSYHYQYDSDGNLIAQTDCSGYTTHYHYQTLPDGSTRLTHITDANGNQTQYHYDPSKPHLELIRQIDYPDGSFIKLEHDIAGRLLRHTDAKGQITQYQYDIDNRPIQRIDALGHTLRYQYDPLRRLSVLTNENGEDWTFSYDKGDNLIAETRFDDYQSQYQYDKLGDLIHQIDNPNLSRTDQRHTYLQRDLIGQLTAKHCIDYIEEEPDTSHVFMSFGQPVSDTGYQSEPIITRRRHTSKYQYDLAGQLIKAVSPDATSRLVYDPVGQIVSETLLRHHSHAKLSDEGNTLAQTLTHEYDELGNRTKTILPDGKALNQLYYGSGHLYNQSLTDELGNVHEIRHSTTDRLHQEATRQQGALLSSFGYDPMGRLIKQYASSEEHITVERHYAYDKVGQLTHLSGRTRLSQPLGDTTVGNRVGQSGALLGGRGVSHYQRNHQYQYDKVGRLVQHRLTDYQHNTGINELFAFDPASNRIPLPAQETGESENGATGLGSSISPSGVNGQATASLSNLQDIDKKTKRPTRLVSQGKQVGYFYDRYGRIKTKTITPVDRQGEPLKQSGQSIVGYRESLQLFYSPNNELERSIQIHQQGLTVTTTTTRYCYDAFGRRIAKSNQVQVSNKLNQQGRLVKHPTSLSNLSTTAKTQRETMLMLWDGNRQVQEFSKDHVFTTVYEQDSFVPVARVVWLQPHLAKNAVSEKDKNWLNDFNEQVNYREQYYRNNPLERENFERKAYLEGFAEIKIYHYHTNHLGTPQELTTQAGDVVWLSYDRAWGGQFDCFYKNQTVGNYKVTQDSLQPIKFQGQYYDVETHLHYNRFRYYDSDVGMFISRDPIELLGGFNVFQYAPNPIDWLDPFGLAKTPTKTLQKNWNNYVGDKHIHSDIHHGFPEEYASRFNKLAGIDVNNPKYYYNLPKKFHTKKPGIHTNSSRTGKNWNKTWKGILDRAESMNMSQADTKKFLEDRLRELARKERISKYNATAMKNKKPCT